MIEAALVKAYQKHKAIAKRVIHASTVSCFLEVPDALTPVKSGSPMFADVGDGGKDKIILGPYKCLWLDADRVRASSNAQEAQFGARYIEADIVARVWLDDVLVNPQQVYGETYLDRSYHLICEGYYYNILGYDRYGVGNGLPYILSVALRGSSGVSVYQE